jgi:hypothetical protein
LSDELGSEARFLLVSAEPLEVYAPAVVSLKLPYLLLEPND